MKYLKIVFFLFLLIGTVLILKNHQAEQSVPYCIAEGRIFGTQYRVAYQSSVPLDSAIQSVLQEVDASLSMFNKKSTLWRINNRMSNHVDSLFCMVFNASQAVAEATNGAFDPTVAPAVNAWGFGFKKGADISSTTIDSLCMLVGFDRINLHEERITKADPRIMLDFSAIAKGYGSDRVARVLDSCGIKNYMVEIGGEVVVRGHNKNGNPWGIGITKPMDDSLSINQELQTVLRLSDCAIATSGNYRNFYYKDGIKYAHTIDPRTGYPVQHSLLSATVIADNCMRADALATAFMVLGADSAIAYCERHPEVKGYFIIAAESGKYNVLSTLEE